MKKRIKNKIFKKNFLECFSKNDWIFFSKYPRLFATYQICNDFTIKDLDRWYYKKFSCNKDIFQNIIKTLNVYVNFDKYKEDFDNPYSNLEKYKFTDLMDNIESVWINEKLPRRIEEQLAHYLINIPKINSGEAIKNILNKLNLESVNSLGVTVKNVDGSFRNLNDILSDINEQWKKSK